MRAAIEVAGLVKCYGGLRAVDGLDLAVPEGTVLGLLGPNGAGKTTIVRILATLLAPDAGRCLVGGHDVARHPGRVRQSIGLSGQYAAVDEYLTGYENLEMVGRLYRMGAKRAHARASELLERFGLADAGHRPARTYSGGMRRRLDLAGALVATPPVLFLDEPTTGLDPRSRVGLWEVIQGLVREGTTVLLTTQYLEEADRLAQTVVVIDHGKVIAEGPPAELKRALGGERVQVTLASAGELAAVAPFLAAIGSDDPVVDIAGRTITIAASSGTDALTETVRRLDATGVRPVDIALHRPTLDDVFLQLTGRPVGWENGWREGAA